MVKIIVGVDESDRSKDAVVLASRLARGSEAELVLVYAYPYDDVPARGMSARYGRYLREDAEAALERAQEGVANLRAVETRAVAERSPAKAIESVAASEDASLIVIGSSHRGGVGRVLAGTTAERLLHGSPCPVAVAPDGLRDREALTIETIGVAYDGSHESKAALAAATDLARSLRARLRLIEVLDLRLVGTSAPMSGPGYEIPPAELEKRAQEFLARVIAELPDEVVAEPLVKEGDPAHELAAETETLDLMIAGSRGYGPHRAVLLGSVSGRLMRDAACPVMVVPRGIEAPLAEIVGAASGEPAA